MQGEYIYIFPLDTDFQFQWLTINHFVLSINSLNKRSIISPIRVQKISLYFLKRHTFDSESLQTFLYISHFIENKMAPHYYLFSSTPTYAIKISLPFYNPTFNDNSFISRNQYLFKVVLHMWLNKTINSIHSKIFYLTFRMPYALCSHLINYKSIFFYALIFISYLIFLYCIPM